MNDYQSGLVKIPENKTRLTDRLNCDKMNWKILNPPLDQVHRLKKEFSSSEIFARAVANRCIKSLIQSRSFFSPSLTEFQNSYLMKDMDITIVIEENEWKGNTTIQLNVRDIIFHG